MNAIRNVFTALSNLAAALNNFAAILNNASTRLSEQLSYEPPPLAHHGEVIEHETPRRGKK